MDIPVTKQPIRGFAYQLYEEAGSRVLFPTWR